MKKFAISLFALAAISSAAFASSNRNYELRESDTYFGKYSEMLVNKATDVNALAIARPATNFERQSWIAQENDQGGRH
jgi:hypothetical protein